MSTEAIITLVFSGIVAISTIAYVILTAKLVVETKKIRQSQVEPFIVAYLQAAENKPDILSVVIKNIGVGVAKNVRFEIIKDIDWKNSIPLLSKGIFFSGIQHFPPGQLFKYTLMSTIVDFEQKMEDYIEFKVNYEDILGIKKENHYQLNFKEMKGTGKLTPPDTHLGMISYRLEKIERLLENVLKNNQKQ